MSIKSKVLAAGAALTLVGGASAAGVFIAGTAGAVTPACGKGCLDLFSHTFGDYAQPNFLLDTFRQGEKAGQPVILFRTSNTDPAEDFTIADEGLVSDFNAAGLVSNALDLHYGGAGCEDYDTATATCITFYPDDEAVELEYSPFGVDSGLCVGVAATATAKEGVTLQPCGVSAKTVWVLDINDSPATLDHGYIPLINGSDTNFSHPFVLTYPANGFPTDRPRPQLFTTNLTGFSNGIGTPIGSVDDTQLWGADFGVLR